MMTPGKQAGGEKTFLTKGQRETLNALCRRILAHLDVAAHNLAGEIEGRPVGGDPLARKRVVTALAAFDNPAVGLLVSGKTPAIHTASSGRARRRAERLGGEPDRGEAHGLPGALTPDPLDLLLASTVLPRHRLPWSPAQPRDRASSRGSAAGEGERSRARSPRSPRKVPARDIDPAAGPEGKRAARVRPNRTGVGVAQGRELPPETMLRAGVCVIGTGVGGAVTAARLAEAGHEVVLLEKGGYYTAADFTEEEGPMTARLYAEGGTRATDDLSVAVFQGRSDGGGTTVNWMIMLRTPPYVLEEWETEHGLYGMGPKEMAPVFEEEVHA
jgi:hypothetical protein